MNSEIYPLKTRAPKKKKKKRKSKMQQTPDPNRYLNPQCHS